MKYELAAGGPANCCCVYYFYYVNFGWLNPRCCLLLSAEAFVVCAYLLDGTLFVLTNAALLWAKNGA